MENIRIIQITDPHIGRENEEPYGVDVRKNLQEVAQAISREKFDFLVLTGDVCFRKPNEKTYLWVKSILDQLKSEYYVLPGNHDDSDMIAKIFGMEKFLYNHELYFKAKANNRPFLFLDTAKQVMSCEQLAWLGKQIKGISRPHVIFMHHPPVLAKVLHMDSNWPLMNRKNVQKILFGSQANIHVFCGHYHVEKSIHSKNLAVHITKQEAEEFEVENYLRGYRVIEVGATKISTCVKYIV